MLTLALPYRRMNGAGNTFVVLDARQHRQTPSHRPQAPPQGDAMARLARAIGQGDLDGQQCDQIITLTNTLTNPDQARVAMDIHNTDGSPAQACGNAARCIGAFVMRETGKRRVVIASVAGPLEAAWEDPSPPERAPTPPAFVATVSVVMPGLSLDWRAIGLAQATADAAPIATPAGIGYAVSVGNPHCVLFVPHADLAALEALRDRWGSTLERHPLFPERTNVTFACVGADSVICARTWERGAGATQACGTAACATAYIARVLGKVGEDCVIAMPGGTLRARLLDDSRVRLTGEAVIEAPPSTMASA